MPYYSDNEKDAILQIWGECDTKQERERALKEAGITRSYNAVYYWVRNNNATPGRATRIKYSDVDKEHIYRIFSTTKGADNRTKALNDVGIRFCSYNAVLQHFNKMRKSFVTN